MNAITRYYALASVSGILAGLLLLGAILLRMVAIVSVLLVVLLLVATFYFMARAAGLRNRGEPPATRAT